MNRDSQYQLDDSAPLLCVGGPLSGGVISRLGPRLDVAMSPSIARQVAAYGERLGPKSTWSIFKTDYKKHRVQFRIGAVELSGWCWKWVGSDYTEAQLMMQIVAAMMVEAGKGVKP